MLARKLIEQGVACVEVNSGMGWDMHGQIFAGLTRQMPQVDKAIGTFVKDLKERGLLEHTVIVTMSEFARTPRINQNAGRDHYPRTGSLLIGGGKIKPGQVYGSTDAGRESVKENPVSIGDLFATLYAALGVKEDEQIRDNIGRPSKLAGDKAKIVTQLVG